MIALTGQEHQDITVHTLGDKHVINASQDMDPGELTRKDNVLMH